MDLYFYRSSPVYWTLITFTNSHTDGRGCHERCQLLIWSNLGLNILLKDTLSCSQGSRRIKPATFRFQENLLYLLSHSQALLLTATIWGSSWWTYPHTVCPLWKRQLTVRYPELAPSHYRERWREKKKRLRWFYHIGSYSRLQLLLHFIWSLISSATEWAALMSARICKGDSAVWVRACGDIKTFVSQTVHKQFIQLLL